MREDYRARPFLQRQAAARRHDVAAFAQADKPARGGRAPQALISGLPPAEGDGIVPGMITTIDSGGRLVIPREIRQAAGIKPGMALDVRIRGGLIEIEPAPLPLKLERRGRLLVAVPQEPVVPLTSQIVQETRRKLRRERGGS